MEPNRTVSLTPGEINVLLQLIDVAVQARGLQVAEVALMLAKKLQSAEPETEKNSDGNGGS